MKRNFFLFLLFYAIILCVKEFIKLDIFYSRCLGVLLIANFAFLTTSTIVLSYSPKGTSSDNLYSKICIATIITRLIIMAIAVMGLNEIHWIFLCDLFTIIVFFIVKRKMQHFTNSQIAYIASIKEVNNVRL